jgi:hypothetical protein
VIMFIVIVSWEICLNQLVVRCAMYHAKVLKQRRSDGECTTRLISVVQHHLLAGVFDKTDQASEEQQRRQYVCGIVLDFVSDLLRNITKEWLDDINLERTQLLNTLVACV